jgi:integral membrane sensor domain MASE1
MKRLTVKNVSIVAVCWLVAFVLFRLGLTRYGGHTSPHSVPTSAVLAALVAAAARLIPTRRARRDVGGNTTDGRRDE